MQISFHGAAREVTGSCYLIQTKETRLLIDCGMFQGSAFADAKNFRDFGFDPKTLDAVIVTHAHLDHTGRLPKITQKGYRGPIYMTPPTVPLVRIVLADALQIMEEEFRREYRPQLYSAADVERVVQQSAPLEYGEKRTFGDLTVRLFDAGHIFGSSFVEVEERGGGRVVFSGDLGNRNEPILRPTDRLGSASAVVIESTYGNRLHEDESLRETKLRSVISRTVKERGVLVIPAFAVERTQEILYELNDLVENKKIPGIDVYLDSPMAIEVSEVIREFPKYYGERAAFLEKTGDDIFSFSGLHLTRSRDESKLINEAPKPKIIIAGAGMMNAGRIQHHLVRYLGNPKTTVLIIGYQAQGTLGRKLYTGERNVHVLGEDIEVRARVESIGAYSAHADQRKLIEWVSNATELPSHVYCTHGEEAAAAALASRMQEELSIPALCPRFEETINV